MIFYSPSFLPAESLQTGGVRWNIHGKILAFEQFLRLVAAQFCVERGMPSGVQGERDLGRKRLLQVDADRLAAQSIALERLGEYGDRTAFEELYVHFAPRLVAFFERRGLDRRRSQETMQDVMSSDLSALAQHFGHERISIVGLSDGGITAITTAIDRPDFIEKLVLIGATYHFDAYPEATRQFIENYKWDGSTNPNQYPGIFVQHYLTGHSNLSGFGALLDEMAIMEKACYFCVLRH